LFGYGGSGGKFQNLVGTTRSVSSTHSYPRLIYPVLWGRLNNADDRSEWLTEISAKLKT
jgi:hypothetical protein